MPRVGPYQTLERAQNEKKNKESGSLDVYEDAEAVELRQARQKEIDSQPKTPPLLPEGFEGPPSTARFEDDIIDAAERFPLGFRNTSASTLYVRDEEQPPKFYTHGVFTFSKEAVASLYAKEPEEPFNAIDEEMLRRQRQSMEASRYENMNKPAKAVVNAAKYLKLVKETSTADPDPFTPRASRKKSPAPRSNAVHPLPVKEDEEQQPQDNQPGPSRRAEEPKKEGKKKGNVRSERDSRTCLIM